MDDIFTVWDGNIDSLFLFDKYINYLVPDLKFNIEIGITKMYFLDTTLKLENMHITSSLYVKTTDRNQLLHFNSFHPSNVFASIPKSQLMSVQRIVSDPLCRDRRLDEMEAKLTILRTFG